MSSSRINNDRLTIMLFLFLQILCGSYIYAGEKFNTNNQGIMIQGFDVVSYFQGNTPKMGLSDYQSNYQGSTYYFVSPKNLSLFITNPKKYAPAYGGFCAYGVRLGQKLVTDPQSWEIINGTLYFLFNQGTRTIWYKDVEKNIEIANQIWPLLRTR